MAIPRPIRRHLKIDLAGSTHPEGLSFRRYAGPQDDQLLADVHNACAAVDRTGRHLTPGGVSDFLARLPNFSLQADLLLAEVQGWPAGYSRRGWLRELNGERVYLHFGQIHPAWRRRGIGRVMLRENERCLAGLAGDQDDGQPAWFRSLATEHDVGGHSLLQQTGYTTIRQFIDMVRPNLQRLPRPPLPPGIEIRPVMPEHYPLIWEANVEAFGDHWGARQHTEKDYQAWLGQSTFDPTIWCVAWEGSQVAGMVLNFIDHGANHQLGRRRGYTEDVCVRRPWRRRGLARAILARSLQMLKEQGMTEAALGVDTDNPSQALRLYRSFGYEPTQHTTLYNKPAAARKSLG
jgi:mycothiol synthase